MRKLVESRRKIIIILGASAAGILVLSLLMFRGGGHIDRAAEADMMAPVYVDVENAVTEPVVENAEATGTVRPVTESQIAPKIMSNVAAVYVREGDTVRRGQLLVKLESADLSAQVAQASAAFAAASSQAQAARTATVLQRAQSSTDIAQAQAALNAAKEQLALAKSGPRKQERSQAHLAVAQARAQYKNSEIELARMKKLFDQDVIPKQRVDQAEMSYDVAKAQYEAALQQADLTEEGTRLEDIRTAEARVRQAEEALRMAKAAVVQNRIRQEEAKTAASEVGRASAALSYAQVQRGYAAITSPVNGIVTGRMVDPGDTVSPGVPMISVEDNSQYRVEATVGESELPLLNKGKLVEVAVDATGLVTKGSVTQIVPSGDPSSRKFIVKVNLPKDVMVRSGQFARIRFPKQVREAITVPSDAVRTMGGLTGVLVVRDDDTAHLQVIKAGKEFGVRTEIISGLTGKERVITSRSADLMDGVPVKVRRL